MSSCSSSKKLLTLQEFRLIRIHKSLLIMCALRFFQFIIIIWLNFSSCIFQKTLQYLQVESYSNHSNFKRHESWKPTWRKRSLCVGSCQCRDLHLKQLYGARVRAGVLEEPGRNGQDFFSAVLPVQSVLIFA